MIVEIKWVHYGSQEIEKKEIEVKSWEHAIEAFRQIYDITQLLGIKKIK